MGKLLQHDSCYTSSNTEITPTSLHWGKNQLICYGSCNSVMIYDPRIGSGGKVISSLIYHTNRVNSVRWLSRIADNETELVSGSSDGNAVVWSLRNGKYCPFVLKGHTSSINIVDGLYKGTKKNNAIIATCAMDFTIKLWKRVQEHDDFQLTQSLNIGLSVGIRLYLLPNLDVILACGLENSNISLYTENDDNHFILANQLQGHEDWVRGLDFTTNDKDIILASSSQDLYIRLWRFSNINHDHNLNKDYVVTTKNSKYLVQLDSILTGHDGWIYSVHWNPKKFQLLSSSLDKTLVIWELDLENNLWLEKARLGDVGGNNVGFYGATFGPDGESILAHSYCGAFHLWKNFDEKWKPWVTIGGHFREVVDLSWEPKGEFVLSVSADQTARIHAPWRKENKQCTWHEIARSQIHGYDLNALSMFSRYKYASAAEEKVIRVFQAPTNFVENFRRICNIKHVDDSEGNLLIKLNDSGPKGASVPSLGLSNKAVFANENDPKIEQNYPDESSFTAVTLTEPPTEETLLQNTLWPEIQKLYGHGYEVYTLAASSDGQLLASACKATKLDHAAIILWDTSTWKQLQKLYSHSLTVVQIQFSPNSNNILTVSRDRRWSLFTKNNDNNQFELAATTDKTTSIHTRIIWCCSWSHDSHYFSTGSREGKIVIWGKSGIGNTTSPLKDYQSVSTTLYLKDESITALAFAPNFVSKFYLVAVGLESGVIQLYNWSVEEGWNQILSLDQSLAHHLTVRRLAFRPVFGKAGELDNQRNVLQLASCGNDHCVRIHNLICE